MKLFFGRINVNQEPKNQLKEAFYYAPKGTSYFAELNSIGDFSKEPVYVYMIANGKVHLWKAKRWGDDGQNLYFDVIIENIEGMNGAWLAAFKYFYLNKDLIVFTIKRPFKKAFFSIDFDPSLTEELVLKRETYDNEENYRKVLLSITKSMPSLNIQLYKDDRVWKIAETQFAEVSLNQTFRDNTVYIGKGRKRKDNVLNKVNKALLPISFDADALAIWQLYDTFFCDYNAADVTGGTTIERSYYKYSPGSQGIRWAHDYETGTISINFNENEIDLNEIQDIKELNELLDLPVDSRSNKSGNMILFKEAKVGDVVFANRGVNTVLGIGIITGEYQFDDGLAEFKHTRDVQWLTNDVWDYQPNQIPTYKSLFRPDTFSPTLPYKEILSFYVQAFPKYKEVLEQNELYFETKPHVVEEEDADEENIHPLNQILYGPPGTGKTYHTIEEAVKIIDSTTYPSHQKYKERFEVLRDAGQIEFVTFHPNYSYEDFMVGLRPDHESADLRFKPSKGIFYRIAHKARENYLASKQKRSVVRQFEEVFEAFIQPLELGERIPVQMTSGKFFYITDVVNGTIRFEKDGGNSDHTLNVNTLKAITEGTREFNSGLGIYYKPLVTELQKLQNQSSAPQETLKHYVLIIDEINRANISRVFGELITLLEDDKRLGRSNELKITLPDGEKDFSVPPNLYLVGTMNTADKSIALIDIALRRRFEFVGHYPKTDVLVKNQQPPERINLLKLLNKAIYQKKNSADFLIGHAYFLSPKSDEEIIKKKIVPLLIEYFNGRLQDVKDVFKGSDFSVHFDEDTFEWMVVKTIKNV